MLALTNSSPTSGPTVFLARSIRSRCCGCDIPPKSHGYEQKDISGGVISHILEYMQSD
jgi:hypothetical protein